MAYDPELAERIRALLSDHPRVREKKMFGGLAFLVEDKMTVCAGGEGALMVRLDPASVDELLSDGVHRAVMRGRELRTGWVIVEADLVSSKESLAPWIRRALEYHRRGAQ